MARFGSKALQHFSGSLWPRPDASGAYLEPRLRTLCSQMLGAEALQLILLVF